MKFSPEQIVKILNACFDTCETIDGREELNKAIEVFKEDGWKAEDILRTVLAWESIR